MKSLKRANKAITLNESTDYRYVSPLAPEAFNLEALHDSCEDFVKVANVDERTPNYRDPAIDAALHEHIAYLNGEYKTAVISQSVKIRNGAKAQMEAVNAEKALLEKIKLRFATNAKGGEEHDY